jgi:putative toxin-antitoxin system antitoxin component (TIGR02293 family)
VPHGGPAPTAAVAGAEATPQNLPVQTLDRLAAHLGWPVSRLLTLLALRPGTVRGWRRAGRPLRVDTGTKVVALAQVIVAAEAYFEAPGPAHRWLQTPALAFTGRTPLQNALRPEGVGRVQVHLGRLEHGVFC